MSDLRPVRTEAAPAPVAGAPYSQAISVPCGRMVFVSGQVPVDVATGALDGDDVRTQTARCLTNIRVILEAAGAGMADVAKTTVFLVDMADFAAMNAVYAEAFAGHAPARATIGVAALPLGARVEIEAVAVVAE
ncbi:MAG: Rid family detoxifying hydrolase [Thermoleophilia bacterium]